MLTIPDEIKDLLHLDSCQKNIRITFPSMVRSDICNDLIVKDSVSVKESLCSQNQLKFGLCEAPVFECETVGVGNVKGETIFVYCEVFCDASVTGAVWKADLQHYVYQIPCGCYMIESCQRQADMNHRRIVAYGKVAYLGDLNDNEILAKKEISRTTGNYEPDIYKTFLMKANLTGRIPGATYTKLSHPYLSGSAIVATIPLTPSDIYLYVNYVAVEIPENSTALFFADYTAPAATKEDVANWLRAKKPNDYDEYFTSFMKWFDLNQIYYTTSPAGVVFSLEARSKGKYVDSYKLQSGIMGPGYRYAYICIPVSVSVQGEYFYFRDPDEQDFYNVSLPSNVPSYKLKMEYINEVDIGGATYYAIDSVDYAAIFEGAVELTGQFALVTRADGLSIINLKRQFGLTPNSTLKPNTNVYPQSVTGGKLLPEDYESCWYDDEYTKPFGMILVHYKDSNNDDFEYRYYLTGYDEKTPESTYQVYDLSNNEIIKEGQWTENQIQTICANIATNISNVSYMPVQFTGRGLPYVEAGDTFEVLTANGDSITTIVLSKTTKGELHLVDEYTSV